MSWMRRSRFSRSSRLASQLAGHKRLWAPIVGLALLLTAAPSSAQPRDFGIQIVEPTRETLREIAPFASLVTLPADHPELSELLRYARSQGLRVSLYMEPMFFESVGGRLLLWPTYRTRFQNFVALHGEAINQETVWALYLIDEPFHRGVAVEDLETVQRMVEKSFPLIPTVTSLNIFDLEQVPTDLPNDVLDIVGLHMYAVPGSLAENVDFQRAVALLDQRFPHRDKMIVADTWWAEGRHGAIELTPEDVGERFSQYLDAARAMGATVVGAFLWESFAGGTGLRDFPDETLRVVQNQAAEISGKCGIPDGFDPLAGGGYLFFQDCRFVATVAWNDPATDESGVGTAVRVSDDTGMFWFFDERNIELTVKLLDGRGFNDHWWVFWSDMTTLDITITLTDRQTGAIRTYTEPASDVTAFAEP